MRDALPRGRERPVVGARGSSAPRLLGSSSRSCSSCLLWRARLSRSCPSPGRKGKRSCWRRVRPLARQPQAEEGRGGGICLVQLLFLLLRPLQALLHGPQPALVVGLYPARLPQGSLPFLVLLGRELPNRGAARRGPGPRCPGTGLLCASPCSPAGTSMAVSPQMCCRAAHSCEGRRRRFAYLGHALHLVLPLPDAQRSLIHLLLLQPQLPPGLVQPLPVPRQLLLLGSQLTGPLLQLCLLLERAQGKPRHELPYPGHCFTPSPVTGRTCPCCAPRVCRFGVQSTTTAGSSGALILTPGDQGWRSWDRTDTHTHSLPREAGAPHLAAHPKTRSRRQPCK